MKILNKKSNKYIFQVSKLFIASFALSLIFYISFKNIKKSNIDTNFIQRAEAYNYEKITKNDIYIKSFNGVYYKLKPPESSEIKLAKEKYYFKIKSQEEEKRRQKELAMLEKMKNMNNLSNYLKKMGSPMYQYSGLILESCEKYGTHYCKYFLSISGVESGFGRVCSSYSAWGMISFKFKSWEEAISFSADWIAKNYYLKGYNTFETLSNSGYHGGDQDARQKWVSNLYVFYNQIPL